MTVCFVPSVVMLGDVDGDGTFDPGVAVSITAYLTREELLELAERRASATGAE